MIEEISKETFDRTREVYDKIAWGIHYKKLDGWFYFMAWNGSKGAPYPTFYRTNAYMDLKLVYEHGVKNAMRFVKRKENLGLV
jgi:hypothetical protein